jgi:hypothetical protein
VHSKVEAVDHLEESLRTSRRLHRLIVALSLACLVLGIGRPRGDEGAVEELDALAALDQEVFRERAEEALAAARRLDEAGLEFEVRKELGTYGPLTVECGSLAKSPTLTGSESLQTIVEQDWTARSVWFKPDRELVQAAARQLAQQPCEERPASVTFGFESWPEPGPARGLATFVYPESCSVALCAPKGWTLPHGNWLRCQISGEVEAVERSIGDQVREMSEGVLVDEEGIVIPRLQAHPLWHELRNRTVDDARQVIEDNAAERNEVVEVIGLTMNVRLARLLVPALVAVLVSLLWIHLGNVEGQVRRGRSTEGFPWEVLIDGSWARVVAVGGWALVAIAEVLVLLAPWPTSQSSQATGVVVVLWVCVFAALVELRASKLRKAAQRAGAD